MAPGNKKVFEELDWRIRVFDSLSFPTLILRTDKKVMTANQRFLEKYKTTLDEVVGKTCHDVFYNSADTCPRSYCPLKQVIEDKKGHSSISRVYTDNGEERWEDRVFSPILDDDGEVKYVMDSVRDVTRLKSLEKELLETKEFLEQVIASSPSAIMAADMQGNILVINEAAEKLFSVPSNAPPGTYNVEDLYPQGMARAIMKQMRDPRIGGVGKLPSTEVTITNLEGEVIPLEITAAIIYEGEREVATMGIFSDQREKRAVEEKLRQTRAQLAQAEKLASMGQLAAGVAHEINNPLTGILFYANMVRDSLAEDDELREDLGFVIEDVHRCKDIVKNLLAYSRQTTQAKAVFQFNDVVEQALNLIRDQKVFVNIRLKRELAENMMQVHVDKNQISQVVINLVMNAVAAMQEKGTLTLRTYRDKKLRRAYLEVEDSGHGIAEENISKIFDPFFTTKEPGQGTGLGLSTVYGLVQENGGDVTVGKTGSNGTTFVVELPLYVPSDDHMDDSGSFS